MPVDLDFYLPVTAERQRPSTLLTYLSVKNPQGLRETPQFIRQDPVGTWQTLGKEVARAMHFAKRTKGSN